MSIPGLGLGPVIHGHHNKFYLCPLDSPSDWVTPVWDVFPAIIDSDGGTEREGKEIKIRGAARIGESLGMPKDSMELKVQKFATDADRAFIEERLRSGAPLITRDCSGDPADPDVEVETATWQIKARKAPKNGDDPDEVTYTLSPFEPWNYVPTYEVTT